MIARCLGLLVVLGLIAGAGALLRPDLVARASQRLGLSEPQVQRDFYRQMVGHHARVARAVAPGAVLFLGSSSVQGLNVLRVTPRGINFGIGGDTTGGLLDRLDKLPLAKAGAVVLAIGRNDLVHGAPAEALRSFEQILAAIPASVPVFVNGTQPVAPPAEFPWLKTPRNSVERFNAGIRQRCEARAGCSYIPLDQVLAGPDGYFLARFRERDGLHLNRAGYRRWMAMLREALESRGIGVATDPL